MTVQELINELAQMPPMMEVYQQTSYTALYKVVNVKMDSNLGIVELYYKE